MAAIVRPPARSILAQSCDSEVEARLAVELKVDPHDGRDVDRVAIDDIRAVAPFVHCFRGRSAEETVALNDVQVVDPSTLRDDGLQEYLTLNMRHAGEPWILRRRGKDEIAGHDARGDEKPTRSIFRKAEGWLPACVPAARSRCGGGICVGRGVVIGGLIGRGRVRGG